MVQSVRSEQQSSLMAEIFPDRRKALIIDDNEIDRRRLKSFCDKSGLTLEFTDADSLAEMRVALDAAEFDPIFIDYRLDDGDGLRALELIKRHPKNCFAATIMIAGIAQTTVAVAALKAGCSDYILKDSLDPAWLHRAVVNAIEKSQLRRGMDASEQVRQTMQIALQGFTQEFAQELKPMLSKMLRLVRGMRGAGDSDIIAVPARRFGELEETCERLWEFAENVEGKIDSYL